MKLGFIGMGNMALAISEGLMAKGKLAPSDVLAYAPNKEKLAANAQHLGFVPMTSATEVASAADIAAMVDKIKASGAKYVFYDSASEKKIAESIAAECGVSVLHLHAVHNITKAEFDAGETYLSLMGKNIETLQGALF